MSEFEPDAPLDAAEEAASDVPADDAVPASGSARHTAPPAGTPEGVVSAALVELDELGGRDLAEHPDVYQRIHGELQRALSAIDDA